MTTVCRACAQPTDAFLCPSCSDLLDAAFGDLPGLINDAATAAVRQARVYRATGKPREPDEDWRGAQHALPPHPMPVDLDASTLLHHARNTLTTWARHLAETRRVPVNLDIGHAVEGPACAGHEHDFTVEGCGHSPDECRQLHPDHRHSMKRRGCGLHVDPDTGDMLCRELHCTHRSCEVIRHGQYTGTAAALVRWFLRNRDSIRQDEAAAEILGAVTALRDELARAVDRTPSPLYAGPCHADVSEPVTTVRDGTVYVQVIRHRCDRDLYAWPGRSEIVCEGYRGDEQGCGTVHTPGSRHEWLLAAVDDALLTIDEMRGVLPTLFKAYPQPPKTVMQAWVRQGRLVAKGLNHAGVETFRGGDLLALVRGYRSHTYAPRPGRVAI